MKKRPTVKVICLILIAFLLVLPFSSCKEKEEELPPPPEPIVSEEPVSEEPPPPEPELYANTLTGLLDLSEAEKDLRPVAVMINNFKGAQPLYGVGSADLIYEAVAEGGITRWLAVFANSVKIPETGSVRSARPYYIDLANGHNAIFVHFGDSAEANKELSKGVIDRINGMTDSGAFYRKTGLNRDIEHTAFTDGKRLSETITRKKIRNTLNNAEGFMNFSLQPDDIAAWKTCNKLSIKFSGSYISGFDYDNQAEAYNMSQFGSPKKDAQSGKALSFKNVFVVYASYKVIATRSNTDLLGLDLSSGSGLYVTDGHAKDIKWSKGDGKQPMKFKDENGQELLVNRGKVYVAIVPSSNKSSTAIS